MRWSLLTSLPRTVTVPILRRRELAGKTHAFVVLLNAERNVEAIAWHPDESTNGAWGLLEAGDELTVTIREESAKYPGTYVGKAEPWDKQPNKLKTAVRNRERGLGELRRSDIELPPAYADALQVVRRAVGDPDTKTYASRIVMAHLGPVVAQMLQEASGNG